MTGERAKAVDTIMAFSMSVFLVLLLRTGEAYKDAMCWWYAKPQCGVMVGVLWVSGCGRGRFQEHVCM